jgi:hypothetical protein
MLLFFTLICLICSELVCQNPIIFHKFDNCPPQIQVRRGPPIPPIDDHPPFNILCENEGTCKMTGFLPMAPKQYSEDLNSSYITSGQSYEGFCSCDLKTIELLGDKSIGDCGECLEFKSYNLFFRFDSENITIDDGITLLEPLVCVDCIKDELGRLHFFGLLTKNENTGLISIQIYVNKTLRWVVHDLFLKSGEDLLKVYTGNIYHYAMFESRLDKTTMDDFVDIGIKRDAQDQYCNEELSDSERIFDSLIHQRETMWWLLAIVMGFWFFIIVIFIVITLILYIIRKNQKKT